MLTQDQSRAASEILPFLTNVNAPITREFVRSAVLMRFPAGLTVFTEGAACSAFTILLSGTVRVFQIGETGREITLYRFTRGESCILTASCILSEQNFPAIAAVEQDAEALVIPHTVFAEWMNEFQPWRTFIFQLLSQRLATVMAVIDEVAFRRMDTRIAEFLLRNSSSDHPMLDVTHQQIAAELGTSREVVTRILADFADSKLIRSTRGSIAVLDRTALTQRAGVR